VGVAHVASDAREQLGDDEHSGQRHGHRHSRRTAGRCGSGWLREYRMDETIIHGCHLQALRRRYSRTPGEVDLAADEVPVVRPTLTVPCRKVSSPTD
jgi:hypothetical protein